jgi:hypothetical protein
MRSSPYLVVVVVCPSSLSFATRERLRSTSRDKSTSNSQSINRFSFVRRRIRPLVLCGGCRKTCDILRWATILHPVRYSYLGLCTLSLLLAAFRENFIFEANAQSVMMTTPWPRAASFVFLRRTNICLSSFPLIFSLALFKSQTAARSQDKNQSSLHPSELHALIIGVHCITQLVLHVVAEKCRVLGVSGSARTRDIGSS